MDFRILGPLEVRANGGRLALGGPKQRALLAILLLQANRVVSSDRLIEELRPIRERRDELAKEPGLVSKVLDEGRERVRPVVRETIEAVRDAMGFSRS